MARPAGKLTDKQYAFTLKYLETGNAAVAYRSAYDVADDARDSWIYVEAVQLLDNPKIALLLTELREQARNLSLFSVSEAFIEYEEARQLAIASQNPSAAVSAVTGKVKLFGLEAPTKSKAEITGKDGGPVKTEETNKGALMLSAFMDQIAERSGTTSETPEE